MKVLLVEDEPDLGTAIKRTLNQEKYIVDWVLDGNEAWYCLENQWTEYTLAIFDWLLPGISGLELCKKLRSPVTGVLARSHKQTLPVLMLTAKDRMEDKVAGLDAGADDYLVKPFGMVELLARLRALQRRSPAFQPQQLQIGNLTLDYATYTVCIQNLTGDRQFVSLTSKEFQLLEYFMKHPNQIVTRDQIQNQLWEMSNEPLSNVVAAQMRLLRRKLSQIGSVSSEWGLVPHRLIETIHGIGYRLNNEPK